ncbi:AfsR/SARP family transcriptional regulator [Streptacidiphilus jiangxiensis]|uniref:DNA-binding transcriptional activator of the SARP family n=1 Tax=Streptacidiphilus jiangxiensis TaxID=235985 RepID=A0A1H7HK24_STRJI|nr:AfsR/SARP family transcriptional regulator [Streptacidiphilus jiangxiensis]SEK50631.1 DNA-binding transcriptional activator of the SARP family [Streptacidiphilus jiangxiensis]
MPVIEFQVLGPMRGRCGSSALAMGSPQQQAMLATLLLRPGRSAGTDELIEALWGDRSPSRAKSILRTYAWRWRKALCGQSDADGTEILVSVSGGYLVNLPEQAVDATRAELLAARAEQARAAERLHEAAELLRQAVALWQGEPLAGIPGPFAERQRRRYSELRLSLVEQRVALDVALGRAAACTPELTALTAEHPLRERLHALLMQALAQDGRQGDALALYQVMRRRLARELGVDPGPDLTAVHAAVLEGGATTRVPGATTALTTRPVGEGTVARTDGGGGADDDVAARSRPAAASAGERTADGDAERADGPDRGNRPGRADSHAAHDPSRRQPPVPAQLPPQEPDFVGRSALVADLCAALSGVERTAPPVLALSGMGGVGKTALALHLAHRSRGGFPDGQLYVDLRGNTRSAADPDEVLGDFLCALGLTPDELPEGAAARSALFRSAADGRRLLIVLDNAAGAAQVRPLLPGAAACAVVLTSRMRLAGLPITLQPDIGVFAPDEALRLLRAVVGDARVDAERDAAAELVRACGRLPLAVRIVAARLAARPSWTVRALVERLVDECRRIDELRIGELAVSAAFELGYGQLTEAQAQAFRLLGAADGAELGLPAAAALLDTDPARAEELLESLVDMAMLESPAETRYRHHDLLRDFARRLSSRTAPGEERAARARLLDHLLARACSAFEQAVPGDAIRESLGSLVPSLPGPAFGSVAEARVWVQAESPGAVALASRIARESLQEDPQPDARSQSEDCLPRYAELLPRAVDLLVTLSPFGPGPRRRQLAETVDELARAAFRHGERRAEGRARFLAGNIAVSAGRPEVAEPETLRAVELCRADGDLVILRQALNDLGAIAHRQGRDEQAVLRFTEAVELARTLGHRSGETASALNAAVSRIRAGRADQVLDQCGALLARLRAEGDGPGTAHTLFVLGLAHDASGRPDDAVTHLEASAEAWTAAGLPGRGAHAHFRLAAVLHRAAAHGSGEGSKDALAQARRHAETALAEFERSGSQADRTAVTLLLDQLPGSAGLPAASKLTGDDPDHR